MGQPWSRIVNSTTKNYIKEREVNILRARKLTAMLKKRGRITFNWAGTEMDYKVKYKRVRLNPYADGDTLEFSRKDRNKTARLPWRGYSATDSMTKGEFLQNRGAQAIVKLYSGLASDLMDDMEDGFGEEFYIDGNDPANEKRLHGIESFMQAEANAGNGAATPTGEFAGLSCVPGAFGGRWTGNGALTWPTGRGDAQYDFWSPIIVDYGDSLFPGGSVTGANTWTNNAVEAISFGIVKSKKSKSLKGMLDMFLIDEELYRQYKAVIRGKERIVVERGQASELVSLGFTDVLNQDGTDITSEYGLPPGVGYGLNLDQMELRSMQAQVFVPEGPDQDITTKSWRFSVDFYGNCVWNPKFQVKLAQITAVT